MLVRRIIRTVWLLNVVTRNGGVVGAAGDGVVAAGAPAAGGAGGGVTFINCCAVPHVGTQCSAVEPDLWPAAHGDAIPTNSRTATTFRLIEYLSLSVESRCNRPPRSGVPSIATVSPVFSATPVKTRREDDVPSGRRVGKRSAASHSPMIRSPIRSVNRAVPVLTSKYWTTMSRAPSMPVYLKPATQVVV